MNGELKRSRVIFLCHRPGVQQPETIYGEMLRAGLKVWSDAGRGAPEGERPGKASVLVVDDDRKFRRFIEDALASRRYEVVVADTATDGMARVGDRQVDLILCDADGSDRTGLEMARECKQDARLTHIPIIVMLAPESDYAWQDCLASGADDWVRKARMMIGEIVGRVQSLIANRKRVVAWCARQWEQVQSACADRAWSISRDGLTRLERERVGKLEAVIEERHRDPTFSVAELSAAIGTSHRALQRLCKSLLGVTPIEIIRHARLAAAHRLIEDGHSVKSAACHAGFPDESDFSRYFREAFGVSANHLKRSLRSGERR